MQLEVVIEFNHRRCSTCGSWWAIEKARDYGNCRCPRCADDEIKHANESAAAAVRSAAASKANATRKINQREK